MNGQKTGGWLLALAMMVAGGFAFGDAAQMPRVLFDATRPDAAHQLRVGGNAKGQVSWQVVENGFTAKLEPGASAWPGVMVVPPDNKPNWDLSLWGHVEAKVTNTGKGEFQIYIRVDNPSEPGKSPWNTEPIKLKPGESTLAKVFFGYSFHHQPNYKLDQSNVVRVQFFLGSPKEPVEFRVENLQAAGWDGEKPRGAVKRELKRKRRKLKRKLARVSDHIHYYKKRGIERAEDKREIRQNAILGWLVLGALVAAGVLVYMNWDAILAYLGSLIKGFIGG
jgi:hypothetical protein